MFIFPRTGFTFPRACLSDFCAVFPPHFPQPSRLQAMHAFLPVTLTQGPQTISQWAVLWRQMRLVWSESCFSFCHSLHSALSPAWFLCLDCPGIEFAIPALGLPVLFLNQVQLLFPFHFFVTLLAHLGVQGSRCSPIFVGM